MSFRITRSDSAELFTSPRCSRCCASVPTMPVAIRPDLRSLLTSAAAASRGEVQAELMAATPDEAFYDAKVKVLKEYITQGAHKLQGQPAHKAGVLAVQE